MRGTRTLAAFALLAVGAGAVAAQRPDPRTAGATIQGKVRPLAQDQMLLQPAHEPQRQAVTEKLRKMLDIVLRAPAFFPPMGLDITPGVLARSPSVGVSRNIVQYEVSIGFFWYTVLRGNEIVPQPVSHVALDVDANHIALVWDTNETWVEDKNRQIFLEPKKIGDVAGYPFYHTGNVVVKKTDRPIWISITREKALSIMVGNMKQAKSELRPDEPARAKEMIETELACLESALAALTSAQRASDAHVSLRAPAGCSPLVEPNAPNSRRLVTENPNFYDRSLPPSAFQMIVVNFDTLMNPGAPWQRAVVERLRNGLDYQALLAMISAAAS